MQGQYFEPEANIFPNKKNKTLCLIAFLPHSFLHEIIFAIDQEGTGEMIRFSSSYARRILIQ